MWRKLGIVSSTSESMMLNKILLLLALLFLTIPLHSIVWWGISVSRFDNHVDRVQEFLSLYPVFLQNATNITILNIVCSALLLIVGLMTRTTGATNSIFNRIGIIEIILGALLVMWLLFTMM